MTDAGTALAQRLAVILEDLRDHERRQPAETDALLAVLVSHLRSWKPLVLLA